MAVDFSPDGKRAYIANQGDDTVSVFNTTTFPPTKIDNVPLREEPNQQKAPRSLVVSPNGAKVYVANPLDNSISIINTATGRASSALGDPSSARIVPTLEGPMQVQAVSFAPWLAPWTILIDPKSVGTPSPKLIVVNRNSNNVGFLNLSTDLPMATVDVGSNPEQNAFDPELPQATVTNFSSNSISLVNTTTATASAPVEVGTAPVAVAVALSKSPPSQGEITAAFESPEAGPVSGIAVIRGWAFSTQVGSQISRVELFIDGTLIGDIPCCSERGDVQAAFPQFPAANTRNSGWGTTFNWGLLSSGAHTVRVDIMSADGKSLSIETRTVTIVKPGDFEFLDRFLLSETTARIAGNELVGEGITVRDKATQRQKRINARFRWFTSSQSLGMVAATTTAQISSVRSRFFSRFSSLVAGLRGLSATARAQAAPGIMAAFESPEEGQAVSGVGVIRGWAFAEGVGASLTEVRLMIDGTPGSTVPCCSERGDVATAFPGNPKALNSGFGITSNYGLLSSGSHTIGVRIGDSTGASLTLNHGVTVVRLGGVEFLDQFDLSGATARVEGEEIVITGVRVRDKATQQTRVVNVRLRWFTSSQSLGIVSSVG